MKLIFIRHGEPDYENDALTPVGAREAELLVPRVKKMDAKEYFVSPLGRAKATAKPSLEALGAEACELDWLREFDIKVQRPDRPAGSPGMCWDWLPSDWMVHDAFYDKEHWADHPVMSDNGIGERYKYVTEKFDEFLKERGYVRNGSLYDAVSPNNDSYVRRSAIKAKIAYITTMAAARAAAEGIHHMKTHGSGEVRSLQEWHGMIGE